MLAGDGEAVGEAGKLDALRRLAALAARVAGVSTAIIEWDGKRGAHNEARVAASGERFRSTWSLAPRSGGTGTLTLLDARRRGALTGAQAAGTRLVIEVVHAMLEQDRYCARLAAVGHRAARADLILHLVSEAASCADALTSLLQELCQHHGAAVGRIWRLLNDGTMAEVSRFNDPRLPPASYYHVPPSEPVRAGNSWTARAILRNQPEAFTYSTVERPERFALLRNAMAAGLVCQVSFPFWIGQDRFGVSLAFDTEQADLDAIVADIASLANTIRPVLHRKLTETHAHHLALHDDLTQLSNRTAFNRHLRASLDAAAATGGGLTLLYLDLDGFKQVNDTQGHAAGDAVLAEAACRLRDTVRDGDLVARLGGDEFAVLQSGDAAAATGVALARRLLDRFAEPFATDGHRTPVGVSIGIACYPADGATPDELLRNADAALYESKQSGRNTFRVFDTSLGARQRARATLRHELQEALETESFRLAYQPICELPSRQVRGLEALLRWERGRRGSLPPREFVPVAEAAGLMGPLGRWVLHTACADAATWSEPWDVAVNLSPLQVRQPGLVPLVAATLAETGLAPHRLDLEVTEGMLLDESPSVLQTLHGLKQLGVRITLDDFGTAHAGLAWLRRFGFDRIKMGQALVAGLCDDPAMQAVVQAVLALAERLGIEVVAEGVEDGRDLDALQQAGCRLAQGFLIGRPAMGGGPSWAAWRQSGLTPVQ